MTIRQAVVPAAGRGARLDRPRTPKPLVEVGGTPMIVRLLRQLEQVGVEEAIVIVGHEGPAVVRALSGHPSLAVRIRFVEAADWEQGLPASLAAAQPLIRGPFVLAMADHVFHPGLVERMARESFEGHDVVALVDRDTEGVFDLAAAMKVTLDDRKVTDIGSLSRYDGVDAGLFLATPAVFDALAEARMAKPTATLSDAMAILARRRAIRAAFVDRLPWDDVDTPAAAVHAEMRLRREHRLRQDHREDAPSPGHHYRFVTGAPATTHLLVERKAASTSTNLGIPPQCGSSPIFVISDETVNGLYGDGFVAKLETAGYQVNRIVMPDGERAKTLENFGSLVEQVLTAGIDEHSVLISLGGGVVCNVTGFAAATLYRGIGLIHVPTTLMAQCDAAISHKQALNGARGKNLIGAYYAPIRIVVDVDFLQTLTDRQLRDGLAEALKHALAQDRRYLEWFMAQGRDLRDPAFLEHVVRRNIELKCRLMAEDPKEHAEGLVLQYAHNVAHAIEYLSGYELMHGEAVSIGMMVAARVSRILGACRDDLIEAHERVLERYGLPCRIPNSIRVADILDAVRYDKKTHSEGVRMPLLSDVGQLWRIDGDFAIPVADSVLAQALEATRG